jgi:hypothetical protein
MIEIVRRCLRLQWSVEKIWKHTGAGKRRIAAIRDGRSPSHRMGKREKLSPEVIWFCEAHCLLDAKIDTVR